MDHELRLLVTAHSRGPTRLDDLVEGPADPTVGELVALVPGGERVWLCGGEPTLRADLPAIVRGAAERCREVGIAGDGLVFARAPRLEGMTHARVALHAARADAHDWLVRRPGSARLAVRALRSLAEQGVATEVVATVTRPTMGLLDELVELCAGLGVRALWLRRPRVRGAVAGDPIAIVPRFEQLPRYLARAADSARRLGVGLSIEGFPRCAGGGASTREVAVEWLAAPGWRGFGDHAGDPSHADAVRCAGCPGSPACDGGPADYVQQFGPREILLAGPRQAQRPDVVRVRFAAPAPVACAACAAPDPPATSAPKKGPLVIDARQGEPTREVRLGLVRAARTGARVLRVASAGSLAHPKAAELLRETLLLGFERVEVCADASPVASFADADLYPLRGIARLEAPLYGPDAASHDAHTGRPGSFVSRETGIEKWARLVGGEIASFAVLHRPEDLAGFARAWASGQIAGEPRFRLSERGGRLDLLAEAARTLDEPARRAIGALLPPCLVAGDHPGRPAPPGPLFDHILHEAPPAGSDSRGSFGPCTCGPAMERVCPGMPSGWILEPGSLVSS